MNHIDELVRETLADRASQAPHPGSVLAQVLRKPERRHVRLPRMVAAAAAVAAVAVGATAGIDALTPDRDNSTTASQQPALDREAAIWAAVLEQTLRDNEDDLFDGIPSRVYVVAQVYDEQANLDEGIPISNDQQRAISTQLADLTTVEWIPYAETPTGSAFPPDVLNDGVPLVSLKPLPEADQPVTARVHMVVGKKKHAGDQVPDLRQFSDAYIVEKVDGEWQVTGRAE